MPVKNYIRSTVDWRKAIRINKYRSYFVIASFFLIYGLVGFLIDLYLNAGKYPLATLEELVKGLLHFHPFPLATFVLTIIAAIAIMVTFAFHNRLMLLGTEYHEVIPETAQSTRELQLYNVIEEMKISAGLKFMPKVFIIEADYMNAFASGYSEKSAMVAITRGLMDKLNRQELQAVMAHELSHIRHMDIKLTLMAAVLTNIGIIALDLLFRGILFGGNSREEKNGRNALYLIIVILRFLLPVITVLLVLYLSRTREFMADAGCVELMRDNEPLASALLKIANDHQDNSEKYSDEYTHTPHESVRREAYIFDPVQAGISGLTSLSDLFSTHPSIERRLAAIGFKAR